MREPKRFWWARPRKLCALERPGGGGRTGEDDEALDQLLPILRRKLRRSGAVAIHANRRTDFVAAVCAAYLADRYGVPVEEGLARAAEAGLSVTH